MLQAGLDLIEVPFLDIEHETVSPFLKKHLIDRSGKEWIQAFITVDDFFKHHMPSFCLQGDVLDGDAENDDELFELYSFLIRLLCALSSDRNLINIGTFPDVSRLRHKLPPEVFLPVKNLLDTFERVNPTTACPRVTVDKDNVTLFQDLLVSQRFTEYKAAHSSLEDPDIPASTSAKYVNQAARSLCTQSRRWIKVRRILVSVLPFSSRMVDMIFGALPGKLAEQFARVTQEWLTRNQRLVIYQMDGIAEQLIVGRIDTFARKRASSYKSPKIK